jgi:hypothetical protein
VKPEAVQPDAVTFDAVTFDAVAPGAVAPDAVAPEAWGRVGSDPVLIDCDSCDVRGIACADCVVTVLLGGPPEPVMLNAEEQRAVSVLAAAGLVPPLRLVTAVHEVDMEPT